MAAIDKPKLYTADNLLLNDLYSKIMNGARSELDSTRVAACDKNPDGEIEDGEEEAELLSYIYNMGASKGPITVYNEKGAPSRYYFSKPQSGNVIITKSHIIASAQGEGSARPIEAESFIGRDLERETLAFIGKNGAFITPLEYKYMVMTEKLADGLKEAGCKKAAITINDPALKICGEIIRKSLEFNRSCNEKTYQEANGLFDNIMADNEISGTEKAYLVALHARSFNFYKEWTLKKLEFALELGGNDPYLSAILSDLRSTKPAGSPEDIERKTKIFSDLVRHFPPPSTNDKDGITLKDVGEAAYDLLKGVLRVISLGYLNSQGNRANGAGLSSSQWSEDIKSFNKIPDDVNNKGFPPDKGPIPEPPTN